MTLADGMLVTGSAAAAGLINAVAGGGTLLTFPALILVLLVRPQGILGIRERIG